MSTQIGSNILASGQWNSTVPFRKTASRHREIISEGEKENAPPPPVSKLPPELEAIVVSESSSPVYPALKGYVSPANHLISSLISHPLLSTHQPSWECPDTAIMRWHRFCLDDLVREILDAYRVVCRRCGGICKLCMKSPYDWYHWEKHRSICLKRGPVKLAVQRRGLKKRGAFKPLLVCYSHSSMYVYDNALIDLLASGHGAPKCTRPCR